MNTSSFAFNSIINDKSADIAQAMLQGCLLEISTTQKPGLVTPISNGSHNDMNYLTFMMSSAAIAPCFLLSASLGLEHKGETQLLLPKIRKIGVKFEERLLASTNQINTQRGILFLGSIICAAAGYLAQTLNDFVAADICRTSADICRGICQSELHDLDLIADNTKSKVKSKSKSKPTAGESLFQKYGITGIRGEIESGLPSVINIGYPIFDEAIKAGNSINNAMLHTLLHIMTYCDDSTIVWRSNMEQLAIIKLKAQQVLDCGSVFTKKGCLELQNLTQYCEQNRLSPGGSADLLAASVAIYILCNRKVNIL